MTCQAIVDEYATWNIRGRPRVKAGDHRCTRKDVETVGHLRLCRQHAKLARQGFIGYHGEAADASMRADYRRYPDKLTVPIFTWLPGADPRNE